jgi:hypothetical protein
VKNLIARTETVEFAISQDAPEKIFRRGRCVIVLGIVSLDTKTTGYELLDFEIQKRTVGEMKVPAEISPWETIDIQEPLDVLMCSEDLQADELDPAYHDPPICMPLPLKSKGRWGKAVVHPKLLSSEKAQLRNTLMFRFIDFYPDQEKSQEYRVRLEVKKGSDNRVIKGTLWSKSSVPAKGEELLSPK